jgi:hypothetical protein
MLGTEKGAAFQEFLQERPVPATLPRIVARTDGGYAWIKKACSPLFTTVVRYQKV